MSGSFDTIVAELLRTGIPLVALVLSGMAVWFTRKLWVQSNRPIVTAAVRTRSAGNMATTYELVVINSGTRPAATVRLTATADNVNQAFEPRAFTTPELARVVEQVQRCFSRDAVIPVLLNGQTLTNAFGFTGDARGMGPFWRVGASIPVSISYSDLEGRPFATEVTLVVRDTTGFAGSYYQSQ